MADQQKYEVVQGANAQYSVTLRDLSGTVIASADIVSLTLTLYDKSSDVILNSRNAVDALNANDVTVGSTDGLLTWDIQPDDNTIYDSNIVAGRSEVHVARFTLTYDTDKVAIEEIEINVIKLATPTAP